MLSALNLHSELVAADKAKKGSEYFCPECKDAVILKKGRRVIPHFSHKPNSMCNYGKGESPGHKTAKYLLYRSLNSRDAVDAYMEYQVVVDGVAQRSDVLCIRRGKKFIFEIQRRKSDVSEVCRRAKLYSRVGSQMWICLFDFSRIINQNSSSNDKICRIVDNYLATDFEIWLNGINYKKGYWVFDIGSNSFWFFNLVDKFSHVPLSEFYKDGELFQTGGYEKRLKRLKHLIAFGPFCIDMLSVDYFYRKEFKTPNFYWPRSYISKFVLNPNVVSSNICKYPNFILPEKRNGGPGRTRTCNQSVMSRQL